jgi:hypothetical protein
MISRQRDIEKSHVVRIWYFDNMFPEEARFYAENGIKASSRPASTHFQLLATFMMTPILEKGKIRNDFP